MIILINREGWNLKYTNNRNREVIKYKGKIKYLNYGFKLLNKELAKI